jgi:hypothetical protein
MNSPNQNRDFCNSPDDIKQIFTAEALRTQRNNFHNSLSPRSLRLCGEFEKIIQGVQHHVDYYTK